jgi:hypothetical protein
MSSLRPATIVATLFHLIGGSLAEEAEPTGPACSCERCEQAWWRNQSHKKVAPGSRLRQGVMRAGPG